MNSNSQEFSHLPGADLVEKGLRDLEAGITSEEALLVRIASPRLQDNDISLPTANEPIEDYELTLYDMIDARLEDGAHTAYNALIARMVSFSNAYDLMRRNSI